jgi:FtsZ-binding cell division protein ZapB
MGWQTIERLNQPFKKEVIIYIHPYCCISSFWSIDARIKKLIEDIGRMSNDINTLKEEISQLKQSKKDTNTTTSKLTSSKGHKTKDEEVDY